MAVSSGKAGGVFASTVVAPVAFTNEAATADTAHLRYSITNRVKAAWPIDMALVVKVAGTTVTNYVVEWAVGSVVFDTALLAQAVTFAGTYAPVVEMGGFYAWTCDQSAPAVPTTDFIAARAEFETFACLGIFTGNVKATRFWDTLGFRDRVGVPCLIRCYVSVATGDHFAAWAIPKSSSASADKTKAIDEPIEFALIGPLYHRDTN